MKGQAERIAGKLLVMKQSVDGNWDIGEFPFPEVFFPTRAKALKYQRQAVKALAVALRTVGVKGK